MSVQDVKRATQDLFKNDPTFTGVQNVSIVNAGNTVTIVLDVGIAGTSKFVPISVQIQRA